MTQGGAHLVALARAGISALFGGPMPAGRELAGHALDQVVRRAGTDTNRAIARLLREIEDALSEFAGSEGIPAAAVERAVISAQEAITQRGLTTAQLVSAGLDPHRAAELVCANTSPSQSTTERQLCFMAVEAVYTGLLRDTTTLPGLTLSFQQEVLSQLHETSARNELAVDMLNRFAAQTIIDVPYRRWSADQFPPSALLRAEYAIVPFSGRQDQLQEHLDWVNRDSRLLLRSLTGQGGMGKTRLALELCRWLNIQGWRSGFALTDRIKNIRAEHLEYLAAGSAGVVIVIDYAETKATFIQQLLGAALDCAARFRVLLLARSRAAWWWQLCHTKGPVGDLFAGPATTALELDPLAREPLERRSVHRQAAQAFADRLGLPVPEEVHSLDSDIYDRVLFLHLDALATVLGEPSADDGQGLLDFALRREQAYLDEGVHALGLPHLAGTAIRQVAALATMAGSAASRASAVTLLSDTPALAGEPVAVIEKVSDLLHTVYPSTTWLAGVQPDLLGEHLVGRAIDDDPSILEVLGGPQP